MDQRIQKAGFVLLLLGACPAWPQANQAAPPRTVTDVTQLIGQYKPDAQEHSAARAMLEKVAPAGASDEEQARFHIARASAAARLGMQEERLKSARAAGALTSLRLDTRRRVLNELAGAEESSGNKLESIRLREMSRSLFPDPGGDRISDNAVLADTYASMGDLAATKRLLEESESLLARMRYARQWQENRTALIERQRGDAHAREGKLEEAAAAYRKAFVAAGNDLELNRQRAASGLVTPSQEIVVGMRNLRGRKLASVLLELGRPAEAEILARDVLRYSLEWSGRGHPETALALALLSNVLLDQGRFRDAEVIARAAQESLEMAGVRGASLYLAGARGRLARALVAQERWQDALQEYERREQGIGGDPELARFLEQESLDFGIALLQAGNHARAAEIFERRHRWWLQNFGATHGQTATALGFLALARAATGSKTAALADLSAAFAVLIAQARNDPADQERAHMRALRFKWMAEGYLRVLAAIHASGEPVQGLDPVAEAFRVADAARGSRVQVALSASSARAAIRDPGLAELARAAQDSAQRISSLGAILIDLLSRPQSQQLPQVVAKMRQDVEGQRQRGVRLNQQIRTRFPEYANLVDPRPVTLEAAQKLLRPGEALVSMFGAGDRTFIWAVPHAGAAAFASVELGAAERHAMVRELRKPLDGEPGMLLREIPEFNVALAYRLFEKLLQPVASGWDGATTLIVVPHGGLGQLPFALLPTAPAASGHAPEKFEGYRDVPWLLRKAAVMQLPSVTALAGLRAGRVAQAPTRMFAGFGDPVFSGGAQAAVATATRGVARRSAFLVARGEPSSNSIQLAALPQLPDTRLEVQEIAAALRANPAEDVFLGARASEGEVKRADLSNRKVVLFATHGLIAGDLDGLTQPALALTNPSVTGDATEDGLLTVEEIVSLKLNADLVVLSACNTAAGDGDGAEAVSGLGRAFFYAGARALLVSNWPVESASARLLTTDLFARLAREPTLAPAEALRRSMLSLMDEAAGSAGGVRFSYAHPTFWAPFSLVGDGRAR